ncbi:MAG: exodeoxyribonuclease III [Hyperionvirus sp.]|uniref:Exodeoxyribonuclease III n=1 Tax=Hyperionvirus sp. TaxID=2487770 RepID=A0A3G5AA51_9VIRU|nr:MAG: exodeoxyribonuclease III [Hyperionvirus sp.]
MHNNTGYEKKYAKYKMKYSKLKYRMVGGASIDDLKHAYLKYIDTNLPKNSLTEMKNPAEEFRLGTYNIHYFTDVWERENTYTKILADVAAINADIIILEEIIIGGDVKIKEGLHVDVSKIYDDLAKIGYPKTVICNTVPSWYNAMYGNMLAIKDNLITKCGADLLCKKYDETIYTFKKSTTTTTVSGLHEGTTETRCYVYVKVPYKESVLHIYGTHSDVASEDTRLAQITYIVNQIKTNHTAKNDISFVLGDFNTIDRAQYTSNPEIINNPFLATSGKLIAYLKEHGFIDLFEPDPPQMTTWNNTRVDFIFCNKKLTNYTKNVYYTKASDHLPIFITLKSDAHSL